MSIADGQNLCLFKQKAKYHALFRICTYIFSKSNKIDAVVTQQNDIYESSNESYITQKKKKNVLRYAKYLYRMKSFNLHITQFQKLKNCSVCNTYNLIFILTFTMAVTLHAVFVCNTCIVRIQIYAFEHPKICQAQ